MSKGKDGAAKDTGVRFKDIAGLDFLVNEMKEIVRLLNKDPAYMKVGAKLPKVGGVGLRAQIWVSATVSTALLLFICAAGCGGHELRRR